MRRLTVALLVLLAGVAPFVGMSPVWAQAASPPPPEKLLDTMADTVGAPLRYPVGVARVSSFVLTMVPGQVTGWHRHDVPLYARVLSGTITVDYGERGKKTYSAGDTFMEAMDRWHNGHVVGDAAAKLLIVFMGAEGAKNTIMRAPSG